MKFIAAAYDPVTLRCRIWLLTYNGSNLDAEQALAEARERAREWAQTFGGYGVYVTRLS